MAGACLGLVAKDGERKNGLKSIDAWPGNWYWKEAGCRRDSSTLAGRMRVSAKPVTRRKAQKSTGSTWYEIRREIPEAFRQWEQKAKTSKKEWKWRRGVAAHPLSESQWNRGHFSMNKWESEKHKSWSMPAEGFKGHVATDGSLLGSAGKWGAGGWSVVQLDHDKELGPLHGMCGSMEAELEVQRAIKRAGLTAFLCLLQKSVGPIEVHVDNKGIIDGLWRGGLKMH